jgi:ABC-type nitrate/sulfonate/bicarbonate transport system substrate-binding protein
MGVFGSRTARILALLLTLAMLLAACGSGEESGDGGQAAGGGEDAAETCPAMPEESTPVTVGAIPGAQDLVMFVMEEEGFATDRNLEIELQEFQNPGALHTAIGQNAVDIGFGGLTAMAVARAQGRDTMIFNVLTSPSNLVFAREGSDVTSFEQVAGGQLGSFGGRGSATFAIMSIVADSVYGVADLGDSAEIIEAPDAALFGLLDEGRVDAALVGTTATVQALLDGGYTPIADLAADYEAEFGRPPGHVTMASSDSYAEENCSVLKAFSGAIADTIEFLQTDDQVWTDYAAEIELTDPEAPELLRERIAGRYIDTWDQEQVDAEIQLIENLIPVLGEADFVSEVPEGLFRLEFQENA